LGGNLWAYFLKLKMLGRIFRGRKSLGGKCLGGKSLGGKCLGGNLLQTLRNILTPHNEMWFTMNMTTTDVFQVSNKWFRTEQVADSTGTYNAWIPCDANGKNVDRCPVCGGHADHRQGLHCGL
jgi:hypothetical protein